MSVLRQLNVLGNMRVDVPHIRSIESSIAADFDVVVGRATAGDRPIIVRGFELANASVGNSPSDAQLLTADSIVYNLNASESGSFLWTPKDRAAETLNGANGKVLGSFTANTVNYVGIDFKRTADASTTDLAQFLDSNTERESGRTIPLGRTLDYVITISTAPFSTTSNIIPIAKITTDINNTITATQDARPLMYRLGSGGDFPDGKFAYSYPFGRQEDTLNSVFTGGDKNIQSEKDWKNAVMTRMWEIGGGENWYSPAADRNVRMVRKPGFQFASGDNFELIAFSQLHWQGLVMLFDNANTTGVYYNEIQDQTTDDVSPENKTQLAVGECLYVDIDRSQNLSGADAIVAKKASLQNLGTPTVPGSRYIIAWRNQQAGNAVIYTRDFSYVVGQTFNVASTISTGLIAISRAPVVPSFPIAIGTTGGTIVAIGANEIGLSSTGTGTGVGLYGAGGAGGANGVQGLGTLTFAGVTGVGGAGTVGTGTSGVGGSGGGVGVIGQGGATNGGGVRGIGGATNGYGVRGEGAGTGVGVAGVGGVTNATGVTGTGGGGNANGVVGTATGTGTGVSGTGGATNGVGVTGIGGSAGYGVYGESTTRGIFGQGLGDGTAVQGESEEGTGGYFVGGGGNAVGWGVLGIGADEAGVEGQATGAYPGVRGLGGAEGVLGVGGGGYAGVSGTGGAAGYGVLGQGTGAAGVRGVGGANSTGVVGVGGTGNSTGVSGTGTGTGAGGAFTSGATGHGVTATATDVAGVAVRATHSVTASTTLYVENTGGADVDTNGIVTIAANGTGVVAQASVGVNGQGSSIGGYFQGTGSGIGVVAQGTATRASLQLIQQAAPTTGEVGDIYMSSADQKLRVCTVAGTPGTWVVIGTQA